MKISMLSALGCTTMLSMAAVLASSPASANDELIKLQETPISGSCRPATTRTTATARSTRSTPRNVAKLHPVWTFSTGVLRGHEGGPLVIGDMMYVHTPFPNNVFALDLNDNGKILWKYEPQQDPRRDPGHVLRHGQPRRRVWRRQDLPRPGRRDAWWRSTPRPARSSGRSKNGDPAKGETMTCAPMVVKDKVLVGISGGEFGVQGRLTAYNLADGKLAWKAYLGRPRRPDAGRPAEDHEHGQADRAELLAVRPGRATSGRPAAASTWGWYSYDPALNLIYYGTGNPSTWNPAQRPGRQQVVDDHLRARPGHRHGEVGLPDDPARRVGLRRRQRDDPGRHQREGYSRPRRWCISTATASATR